MTKKYFALLSLLFVSLSILSQNLDGNYKDGVDSLSFSDGKATFNLSGFGALFTRMCGEGKYEYFDDYLLVNTEEYSGKKSISEAINASKKDTIVVKVVDFDNYSVQGALVEFLSESDKVIHGVITDDNGKLQLPEDAKIKSIKVSNLGYDNLVFDYAPKKDFFVKLAKNSVIENQTVAFRIKNDGKEMISVILLSDNFEPRKNRMKSLEKLDRKAKKKNVLPKRLKKEYIPIYGR